MKFCLVQALEENCLFIRSAGNYDAQHVRAMIRSASSLDFYQRRVAIMYDMRMVHFTLDRAAIKWLVQTLPDVPKHSDTAMVADTDIGFEMISLYADLRGISPRPWRRFAQCLKPWIGWQSLGQVAPFPRRSRRFWTRPFAMPTASPAIFRSRSPRC